MRGRLLFTTIILFTGWLQADAQATRGNNDTTIKGSTIEIENAYKPEVKRTPKPELTPTLPPADTSRPAFKYDVPQQTLYYSYSSLPLRPLALGKDTGALPFQNYVKLGAGNLSTLYLDAGIGSLKGKDYETAFHIHHLSQNGDIAHQQSAMTGIEADGSKHMNGMVWHGMVDLERNQFNYYGYNHNLYDFTNDSIRQTLTNERIGIDMQREQPGAGGINYHPSINESLYADRHNTTETSFDLNAPFSYNIDSSLQVIAALDGKLTFLRRNNASSTGIVNADNNNIGQLMAGLNYHHNLFAAYASLAPTLGKGNIGYLLPNVGLGYTIPKTQVNISAGWNAQLRQNTYEQLSTENPYIFNDYEVMQTRTDEIFANLQGNVGHHLTFDARVSYWHYSDLPLFLNNLGDEKQFAIRYDHNQTATSLQGSLRYQIANTFAAGFSAAFYDYNTAHIEHVWETPYVRVKGDLLFNPFRQLTVTAYLTTLDGIYALNSNNQSVKLPVFMDIGASAEYNIVRRVSLFINVANLLNNKNERWMNYEGYGINIYGGVRVNF